MTSHPEGAKPSDTLRRLERLELPFVLIVLWLIFISVPLYLDRLGLSWDALNHHIYLGWVADSFFLLIVLAA